MELSDLSKSQLSQWLEVIFLVADFLKSTAFDQRVEKLILSLFFIF